MMEAIRNATKSWLAVVVVGLLIISFAIWGVQDAFTPNPNQPVAVVNGTEISQQEYFIDFSRRFNQFSRQMGNRLTLNQARQFGMDLDTLDFMVSREVLSQVSHNMGIRASDRLVTQTVVLDPNFAGPSGRFDQRSYQELLFSAGFTPQTYEDSVREDLMSRQLLGTVVSGAFIPEAMASALYEYAFEERTIEYFLLPPLAVGDVEDPGDEVLEPYYTAHSAAYRQPEYRNITVLHLTPEAVAEYVEVPEEDIERLYNIRERTYQVPERRTIDQLTFTTREAAETALSALRDGRDFNAVGGNYVEVGTLGADEGLDPAVTEAAFALEEPGMTDVVDGALSFVIARVTDIQEGRHITLEEVADDIRMEIATQEAEEMIYELAEQVMDMDAGGMDLAAIGERLNLPVLEAEAIDATGATPDGETREDITSIAGLVAQVFDTVEGDDTGLQDTPDGDFYVARVNSVDPAHVPAFADVRAQVLEAWRDEEIDTALRGLATDAAARINSGDDFTAVAEELGRTPRETPRPMRRSGTTEIFSGPVLSALFLQDQGTAVSGPVQLGASYVVAHVTDVTPADPSSAPEDINTLQENLSDEMSNEIMAQFIDHARENATVRINEDAMNQALTQGNF